MTELVRGLFLDGKWSNHPDVEDREKIDCNMLVEPGELIIEMTKFKWFRSIPFKSLLIPLDQIKDCSQRNDYLVITYYDENYEANISLLFSKGWGIGLTVNELVKNILRLRAEYLKTLKHNMSPSPQKSKKLWE